MKLYDRKRIALIIFFIIVGMIFSAYLLYDQRGTIGRTEIIALILTAVIAIAIATIMIVKGNK
jgi:hypothetical protein